MPGLQLKEKPAGRWGEVGVGRGLKLPTSTQIRVKGYIFYILIILIIYNISNHSKLKDFQKYISSKK